MIGRFAAVFLAFASICNSVEAQERKLLGFGNLLVNDAIGDGQDRWRTGSYTTSRVWGRGWDGALPQQFGDIVEFRFGGEIIGPANLTTPAAGERPWAGMFFWGLHSHFQRGGTDISLGGDIVAIGPMTRLDQFQTALHDLVGIAGPSDAVLAGQIPNTWSGRAVLEMGREMELGQSGVMRPFVEARAGDETLVRAGVDMTIGTFGQGELLVRDWVTGHRYRTIRNHQKGVSFVMGADVAKVFDSLYLPADRGYELTDYRGRLRAGIHWRGDKSHVFYGLTWLSEEFEAQPEGQLVGAVKIDFKF